MPTRILVVDDSPTIRGVVRSILERSGYEAILAGDGQEGFELLADKKVKADLVLLDFVMPRMDGYQFCRAIRSHNELGTTPVVLMSAKADRIREQFIQQTGALDTITKPFDARALLVVVENALRKIVSTRSSSSRLPSLEHDDDHVVPQVTTWAPGTTLLAGDLGVVPIGAILQLLQSENQSGVLVCTRDGVEVRASFDAGMIDLVEASGAGDEFLLGRFLVEEGIITPGEIETFVDFVAPPPPHRPLGTALVATGRIAEAQLRAALVRQSSELLYEVLRWPAGTFALRREPPSELASSAKLRLPVASVVLEGFRRVDEWRALERTLGSFDAVLVRDDAAFGKLDPLSLPPREQAVLDAVNGERTVRAIVSASHLSTFDACRILVQFLEARVLRRRAG